MRTRARALAWVAAAGLSISCAHDRLDATAAPVANVAPAPIRAFDLATIEKLGREIYQQDCLAFIATEVLFAQRTEQGPSDDGVRGWITGTTGGKDVVRFIRVGGAGPEALYDVTIAEGPPTLTRPASAALSPEESAQYRARMLALANIQPACSDRYNTVALRDPESDGWLVWALAATVEPNVIPIGGHYRFAISPDGNTIRARDALSTTCLRIQPDEDSAGEFVSHVVSLTPVETHVFSSLNYKRVLHVGTNDGTTWRVDAGRVSRVDQADPDIDGYTARHFAAMHERCAFVVATNETPPRYRALTNLIKVIEQTEQGKRFALEEPADARIHAIICGRMDIVPAANDYKVASAGYKLVILDMGQGHEERTGELTFENGRFAFALRDGEPLTEELTHRVNARLDRFQRFVDAGR
jgi:hypothetical protein